MKKSHWLDDLNPAQRQAVTHGDGPLLIVAGAGTGKTKTLACRVAWLVEHGVPAERILLLTFTRRAAAEMIGRAGQLTSSKAAGRVWGGTFHAVANRLLRVYARALQLSPEFTVIDQGDAADLMNLIRSDLGLGKAGKRFPRKETLVAIYSRTVNAECQLRDTLEDHFPWCAEHAKALADIFKLYTQRKREQNVLDYDDLLLYWSILAESPETGDSIEERFDHILVDEYQDTNAVQSRILRAMRKHNHNLCVVGDDAQSIYSFRAASVRNILDFPQQFPNTRVVTLEQNYRSTQSILGASNAVMERARERFTKNLWSGRGDGRRPVLITCTDEQEQSHAVCRQVLSHLESGVPLNRQAVLFRVGYHSDLLEVELARRHIPFHKYGGLKFIEAAHVKDMLAFLRVLENPYDEISWFRVLQLLPGIGPAAVQRILAGIGVRAGTNEPRAENTPEAGTSPLRRLFDAPPAVPAAAQQAFRNLRITLAECCGYTLPDAPEKPRHGRRKGRRAAEAAEKAPPGGSAEGKDEGADGPRPGEPPLGTQIECVRRFYEPIFENRYENPKVRLRDLEQLEQLAAGTRSRSKFITDLTLDPPSATSDLAGAPFLEEDYLILSTIHSAKGCEWDVVHIIHAADGNIPSDMALSSPEGLEEERRLLYVAMTRAKDMLYVCFPLRYYRSRTGSSDRHHYAQLTRFLADGVAALFEQQSASGDGTGEDRHGTGRPVQRVDDWLNRLWKQ